MPDYNLPLPQENAVNFIDLETPPRTTNLAGFAISAYNQLFSLPASLGFNKFQEFMTNEFDPGKHLTSEEYDKSPWKIKGLNFPNGVNENVAKLRYNRRRDFLLKQDILNNMQPGFMSSVSREAGSLVGMLVTASFDPAAVGTAALTTSLTGRLMPWVLTKLSGTAARLTTKFLGGAVEGAVIGAPFAYTQYKNLLDIGIDEGKLSMLVNDGMFAGLGGFARVGLGWKRPIISSEDHVKAREIAINHVLNGKPAYIEPIIKNAVYQMSRESEPFILHAEDAVREIQPKLDKVESDIESKTSELKGILEKRKIGTALETETRGDEFVERLEEARTKPSDLHTEEDTKLLRRFATRTMREKEPTILQKAHDISEKQIIRRSDDEQTFLEDFIGKKEKERTFEEIDNLKKKRDEIKEEMDKTTSRDKKTKLRFKLSDFNDRIEKNEKRLSNLRSLDKLEKDDPKTFKLRSEIKKLERKRDLLRNTKESSKLYAQSMNVNGEPLSEGDLRSTTAWVNDWKSDFAYSHPEFQALEEEIKIIPDGTDLDIKKELDVVNEMRKNDLLSDEKEDFLDNFKTEDDKFDTISKALRDYVQCLLREGE